MKLSIDFPSVASREGVEGITKLAQEIENIGFDQLDMLDHVVMGYNIPDRPASPYPAKMPILESLMTLSFFASVTKKIGLGTEVLVLPQRQPVLVAKQISTLDLLSKGRVRLGVGVGWQESEYEALGEKFNTRGRRMDQCIDILRHCWADDTIDFEMNDYTAHSVGMEPKPVQGQSIPIWVGGHSDAALRRVGRLADGWLGTRFDNVESTKNEINTIKRYAEEAGRDPQSIPMSMMLAPPIRGADDSNRDFYRNFDKMCARFDMLQSLGFTWVSLNATNVFQAGARSVDALIDSLGNIHERLRQQSA
jgi:probable F420-dependent oxidoreductase